MTVRIITADVMEGAGVMRPPALRLFDDEIIADRLARIGLKVAA